MLANEAFLENVEYSNPEWRRKSNTWCACFTSNRSLEALLILSCYFLVHKLTSQEGNKFRKGKSRNNSQVLQSLHQRKILKFQASINY